MPRRPPVDTRGPLAEEEPAVAASGLAALSGPVILSWSGHPGTASHARDGQNVILHEFAHKLDMRDGAADGAPYLENNAQIETWSRVMSAEYQSLGGADAGRGERDVLNPYGATNAAEFFAVATESFFESATGAASHAPGIVRRPARLLPAGPGGVGDGIGGIKNAAINCDAVCLRHYFVWGEAPNVRLRGQGEE